MHENFKNIHIGKLIKLRVEECSVSIERAAAFLKVDEDKICQMYKEKSLDCEILLRWSKLLKYDFFRIYSQHLILYSPQNKTKKKAKQETKLPVFKKNIYTQEVINYLIELLDRGEKDIRQIQEDYNIPSTTILRWRDKYGKKEK